jgi:hypothetical protein
MASTDSRTRVDYVHESPKAPDFLGAQEAFARAHSWFTVKRLDGVSHFPQLEMTDETAGAIGEFIG